MPSRLDGCSNQFGKVVYEISGGQFAVCVSQCGIPRNVDETKGRFNVSIRAHPNTLMPYQRYE